MVVVDEHRPSASISTVVVVPDDVDETTGMSSAAHCQIAFPVTSQKRTFADAVSVADDEDDDELPDSPRYRRQRRLTDESIPSRIVGAVYVEALLLLDELDEDSTTVSTLLVLS